MRALKEQKTFPKMIFIIPDADLAKFCIAKNIYQDMDKLVDWLIRECDKLVEIKKECLPSRSKKAGYPAFIWIEAPLHDNFT